MTDLSPVKPPNGAGETIAKAEHEALERYGITRVPAEVYLVGPYRYSNLADAVAQAHRVSGAQEYYAR